MGTTLVYSAALLLVAALATASSDSTSTTTTPPSPLASDTDAAAGAKSKRGVVDVGTNLWASQGSSKSKSLNPSSSSTSAKQNSGSYSPQSTSTSSAYAPAQNEGRSSAYNTQSSGYKQAAPYSAPSYTSADQSYGNVGQSYGSTGQSYLSSPQNYGSTDQGQNSAFSTYYAPQSQSTNSQSTPSFESFLNPSTLASSAQSQGSQQGAQIQNSVINTPYYSAFASANNPVKIFTDKLPSGQYRASLVQTPYEQQNVFKVPSMYAPNHQSGSYIIPAIESYPYQQGVSLSQGSPYVSQASPAIAATSQVHRNTPKSNFPGQKSQELPQMYAPHHQSASSFVPNVQSTGFGAPLVNFNGKRIPLPVLQLQSAEDFPGFAQSINTQPIVLETNLPYQGPPDFGFLADFTKSLSPQAGNILPFLNPQQSHQPQVLPVRSANGSPQFPQYKGASINTIPTYNHGKPAGYQPLNSQPQLHFTGKQALPSPPPTATSSIIRHPLLSSKPVAEIRDDVEVIKKKKRPSPPPADFDEDEVDEGYKAIEREYGRSQDDSDDEAPARGKYLKEADSESDYKPLKTFPFKSYDETFSKYTKPSSDDDVEDERPVSRYRHASSAEEDDDYDGHSSTQYADYRSPKARPSRYEDDGEESQKQERQEEAEEDEEHEKRPSAYRSYGKDFEQEFEDSYKRELPMNQYVHKKEVPEIDEPAASSHKSYSSSDSPSKYNYKGRRGYHQDHDEEPEDRKSSASHVSQKYRKNGDNDGYSSNVRSHNKAPKVVHEESFGYKTPASDSYSKYKKSPTGDSYSSVKKSPKMDSYVQASRSSFKSPKNDKSFENGDSYSYSTGSSWKSDKKSPETSDSYGHGTTVVKTLAQPDSKSTFHAPAIGRGNFFYSKSEKIVRDLTGI